MVVVGPSRVVAWVLLPSIKYLREIKTNQTAITVGSDGHGKVCQESDDVIGLMS